jgi:hypothetical protein
LARPTARGRVAAVQHCGYLDFAGTVEPERMQHAVALLVARHDALRTQLHTDAKGLPGQVAVNGAVERGTVFCRIEGWIG